MYLLNQGEFKGKGLENKGYSKGSYSQMPVNNGEKNAFRKFGILTD
jgi:hypothetical protein